MHIYDFYSTIDHKEINNYTMYYSQCELDSRATCYSPEADGSSLLDEKKNIFS